MSGDRDIAAAHASRRMMRWLGACTHWVMFHTAARGWCLSPAVGSGTTNAVTRWRPTLASRPPASRARHPGAVPPDAETAADPARSVMVAFPRAGHAVRKKIPASGPQRFSRRRRPSDRHVCRRPGHRVLPERHHGEESDEHVRHGRRRSAGRLPLDYARSMYAGDHFPRTAVCAPAMPGTLARSR